MNKRNKICKKNVKYANRGNATNYIVCHNQDNGRRERR